MTRTLISALGLGLALSACFAEEKAPESTNTDPTTGRDGEEIGDDDDEDDIEAVVGYAFALRPVTVSPFTLPAADEERVRLSLAGDVTDDDGEAVALDEAVAATEWSVLLPDGTEVPATATVEGDRILLEVTVPGGEARSRRQVLDVYADDDFVAEAAVGRWMAPEALLEGKLGDATGFLGEDELGGLDLCWSAIDDADADGILEVLMVGIDGDGRAVFRGCTGFLDPDTGAWECEDEALDAELEDGEGLYCGDTDHFRPAAGGGSQVSAVFRTSRGGVKATSGPLWSGSAWSNTARLSDQTSVGVAGRVLGMNSTKEEAEVPVDALLLLREGGGRWTGIYQDGREPGEWTDLLGVSATDIGSGAAWAGLFAAHDLRPRRDDDDSVEDPFAWAIAPEGGREGGRLVLNTGTWNASLRAFVRNRQLVLDDPGFVAEHVVAAGEDLDRDGIPELVVEAWGEGSHAAWVVRSATDKADLRPVIRLENPLHDGVSVGARARLDADGEPVSVSSSFVATAAGGLVSQTLSVGPDGGVIELVHQWADATAWGESDSEAAPDAAALLSSGSGPGCPTSASGTGVCLNGTCACLPGYSAPGIVPAGGGDGATVSSLPADHLVALSLGDGGGLLVNAQQALLYPTRPRLHIRSGTSRSWRLGLTAGADGAWVALDDAPVLQTTADARLAAVPDSEDELAVFIFEPQPVPAVARAADATPATTTRVAVRVYYHGVESLHGALPPATMTGGTSIPVLLGERVRDDGTLLLAWRDGAGQAWAGWLDLTGTTDEDGVLPFVADPVTVGGPVVDPEGVLGLTLDSAGIVAVRTRPLADTPFFSMEDLEERFSAWEEPPAGAFDTDDSDGGSLTGVILARNGDDPVLEEEWIIDFYDSVPIITKTAPSGGDATAAAVPRMAYSPVPDGPQVVVSTTAAGDVRLSAADREGVWARTTLATGVDVSGPISAGDLNGDGLSDLVFGSGPAATSLLSDGEGGALDVAHTARAYTNFAVLLGGTSERDECAVDPDGGAADTEVALRLGSTAEGR